MTYRWNVAVWGAVIFIVLGGCELSQTRPEDAAVHNVHIGDEVTPKFLSVQRGDEIRWHNLRPQPVKIGLLDIKWRDHLVCEKGFKRFGQVDDLVVIQPQEYVSLCFSHTGTVRYNVWLDPNNLTGSMTPTSTIRID